MRGPLPYRIADKAIARLNKLAVQRASKTKKKLAIEGFDEANVFQEISALYTALNLDNRKAFRKVYFDRYCEMYLYIHGAKKLSRGQEDEIDELIDLYLAGVLSVPDPITKYAYDAEMFRKRDRAIESINAVKTNAQKDLEFVKALRYWSQMSQQYVDIVSDDASVQAMKDSGVKYVVWHTQEDEKVCGNCDGLDNKVFPIDKIPEKPHWRCRCWVEASNKDGQNIKKSVENTKDSGIIKSGNEMFRKKSENTGYPKFKPISDERFDQLTINARKHGAVIIRGEEWVEKRLDDLGAAASTIGNIVLFRKNVSVSEVLEETRHFEQNRIGMNDDKDAKLRTILNEIDARDYIFENAKRYHVPREEIEFLKLQYEKLKEDLIDYFGQ